METKDIEKNWGKVKRVPYNAKTSEVFEVKKVNGDKILYENGEKFNGKL